MLCIISKLVKRKMKRGKNQSKEGMEKEKGERKKT